MSIGKLYNTVVSTKRLSDVAGSKRETFATNIVSLRCHIQSVSSETQMPTDGSFYTGFKMWCASSADILEGDKVISGSDIYVVRGVASRNFGRGSDNRHLEIMLVKTI